MVSKKPKSKLKKDTNGSKNNAESIEETLCSRDINLGSYSIRNTETKLEMGGNKSQKKDEIIDEHESNQIKDNSYHASDEFDGEMIN